ncbi:hypothetical protein BJY01DRAFT_30402 [Aspergillus pseudoustus]|uniref:Uncharacterized protein n=1 Tax=Aspergillus pseudoustus TaxID=1810923 RepID=A0ABR4KQ79_9EURO
MPPTRSASSRSRKRPSMNQALDLINSVMSRKGLAADNRQTQSAQSVRQLRNLPRAPRRDIWDVPDSPDQAPKPTSQSPRLAADETWTPRRRSTRLRDQAQALSSPTMARTRSQTAGAGRVEQNAENQEDSWHPSQQASDDGSNNNDDDGEEVKGEEEDTIGEDIDFYGNFNVFSDDVSRSRSSSIRSPTPSAALRQDLERVEQTQTTPRTPKSSRRVTELRSGERRSARLRATSHRSIRTAAEPKSSVVVKHSPNTVREAPVYNNRRTSTRLLRSHGQDADGDVEMANDEPSPVNGHQAPAEEDSSSPFVSSASSASSPGVGEPSLPETRSGTIRQPSKSLALRSGKSVSAQKSSRIPASGQLPEPPGPEFSWSPPPEPSIDAFVESSSRQGDESSRLSSHTPSSPSERSGSHHTPRVRRHNKRSWRRVTFSQKAPEQESFYPRCKEAMEYGQQRDNWKTLIKEIRLLERQTDPALEKRFQDILDLISHSQKWYESLPHDPENFRGLSLEEARKSDKLLDSIRTEGDELLDVVFYRVTKRKESSRERGLKLFQEFEARVIPAVVQLVFSVFDAYHTDPERFAPTYGHLHRALRLALWFCNRIRSLAKEQYVRCVTRSKNLLLPLRNLIEASESNTLKKPEPELEHEVESESDEDGVIYIPSDDDDVLPLTSSYRPFSDAEGRALLDGLQLHQGPERYILIHRNLSELEGRTIRELREEARRMCDQWEPLISDELSTQEGRDEWRWLLSVRERDSRKRDS